MTTMRCHPELGTVEVVEVYEFFDEPVLFAGKNELDHLFLVVLSSDGEEDRTWLHAPMSKRRFDEVRSGGMELHAAFRAVEGGHVFKVVVPKSPELEEAGVWVPIAKIDDALLPLVGERLDLPTATLEERPDLDAGKLALQVRKEVIALRLRFEDGQRTEAPAGLLGQLLDGFQQTVTAVGQTALGKATKRARIPLGIVAKTRLVVVGTFAGSFGVELHAEQGADMFGESPLGDALEQLARLLEATKSDEALLSVLQDLKAGRSASKYREFLLRFTGGVQELRLEWGSPKPERERRIFSLTADDASRAVRLLGDQKLDEPSEFEVVGRLIGLNVRTKTYELWDTVEGRKYSGRVVDDAMDNVAHATINDVYVALIREEKEVSPTGDVDTGYKLLRLVSRTEGGAEEGGSGSEGE